jgi:hypothetical protein
MDKPEPMGHVVLDRRQDPRFPISGRFRSLLPPGLSGNVADVSLNGARLRCATQPELTLDSHTEWLVELTEGAPFAVKARVAHLEGHEVGIEFEEMAPKALEELAERIEALRRAALPIGEGG